MINDLITIVKDGQNDTISYIKFPDIRQKILFDTTVHVTVLYINSLKHFVCQVVVNYDILLSIYKEDIKILTTLYISS